MPGDKRQRAVTRARLGECGHGSCACQKPRLERFLPFAKAKFFWLEEHPYSDEWNRRLNFKNRGLHWPKMVASKG